MKWFSKVKSPMKNKLMELGPTKAHYFLEKELSEWSLLGKLTSQMPAQSCA